MSLDEHVWTFFYQENVGLEQELQVVKVQLTDAQNSVSRLQNDLDQLLNDKVLLLLLLLLVLLLLLFHFPNIPGGEHLQKQNVAHKVHYTINQCEPV